MANHDAVYTFSYVSHFQIQNNNETPIEPTPRKYRQTPFEGPSKENLLIFIIMNSASETRTSNFNPNLSRRE